MPPGLRPFVVLTAGVVCLVLAFVVLAGHPRNEVNLLAWIGVAAGAGLIVLVLPSERVS